jgi:predicted transcriptional regulator
VMIDLYSEINIQPDLTPALVNQAQNQGMVLSQQEIDQSLSYAQQSLNNSERLEEVILAMLDYVRKNRIDSAQRINSMLDSTNSDINQINQNMLTNIAETLTNNNSNDERLINSFQAFLAGK